MGRGRMSVLVEFKPHFNLAHQVNYTPTHKTDKNIKQDIFKRTNIRDKKVKNIIIL